MTVELPTKPCALCAEMPTVKPCAICGHQIKR
jgi:recombinational DNA repair protein RecR